MKNINTNSPTMVGNSEQESMTSGKRIGGAILGLAIATICSTEILAYRKQEKALYDTVQSYMPYDQGAPIPVWEIIVVIGVVSVCIYILVSAMRKVKN